MKVFVLKPAPEGGWDLVGDYDLEQIPHVGEKILIRSEAAVLEALPVTDVQHFVTGTGGSQGAFVHVAEGHLYEVPAEMAEFFAR